MQALRKFSGVVVIILLSASITYSVLEQLGPQPKPVQVTFNG